MSLTIKPSKYTKVYPAGEVDEDLNNWPERLYNAYELEKLGEGDRQPSDYELKEPDESKNI